MLRGFFSQLALWRLLAYHGLWHYPRFTICDQAVYSRLEREGVRPLERLMAAISALLAERLTSYVTTELAPFATKVVAIDETTLGTREDDSWRDLDPGG